MFKTKWSIVAVSVATVAAIAGGGIAWASSPVSGGVVHGCYNAKTGALELKVVRITDELTLQVTFTDPGQPA